MTGQHTATLDEQAGTSDRELAQAFSLAQPPAGFVDDPYPTYAALLAHAPVKKLGEKSYMLSRHADLTAVYKDTSLFSSDKTVEFGEKYGDTPLFEHHTTSLVFNDPPLHTRVRSILAGALNPRAVSALEGDVEALVGRLLDQLEAKADSGEAVDLIEEFASAIPVEVIGNLLAVPHEEREPLRDWSLAILGALEPVLSAEEEARGNKAVTDFLAYLETLVARRRKDPGDPEKDMLTRLIQGEKSGEKLSEKELLQNCIFILNAGHETTTNLIGNGLELLHRFAEQRQRLLDDPTLIRTAVEEMLRYESSNQLGNRMTTGPATFDGIEMPAGTFLTLCIGAANRDPAVFDDPDRFDIGRRPNRHLAFASGPHQCIGMSVARMEGQIVISRFLERFPAYHLTEGAVRSRRLRFRGYTTLPARLR